MAAGPLNPWPKEILFYFILKQASQAGETCAVGISRTTQITVRGGALCCLCHARCGGADACDLAVLVCYGYAYCRRTRTADRSSPPIFNQCLGLVLPALTLQGLMTKLGNCRHRERAVSRTPRQPQSGSSGLPKEWLSFSHFLGFYSTFPAPISPTSFGQETWENRGGAFMTNTN